MAVAVSNAYASPDEYRSAISKTDDGDDQAIAADLMAISRYLDKRMNRFFTVDAADVTRVYYPRVMPAYNRPVDWAESENPWLWGGFSRWLFIDDVVSVTSIVQDLNGNGLADDPPLNNPGSIANPGGDYQLLPLNAPLGPEPQPYTAIFIPTWSSTVGGFVTGRATWVTGKFGWPAVPAAIHSATIQLAAILRLESPRATSRINELQQVVSTSKVAQDIINELLSVYYRKESLI